MLVNFDWIEPILRKTNNLKQVPGRGFQPLNQRQSKDKFGSMVQFTLCPD
jgi:hypothetical protein